MSTMQPVRILLATTVAVALQLPAHAISVPGATPTPGSSLPIKRIELNVIPTDNRACPKAAFLTGRIFANGTGPVEYMIVVKDGLISGPWITQAKKSSGGYVAEIKRTVQLGNNSNTQFKVVAGKSASRWASTNISCK